MFKNKKRAAILISIGILATAGFVILLNWRSIGTQLANPMRQMLGIERVAQLESLVFELEDQVKQWQYKLGMDEPEMPSWALAVTPAPITPTSLPTASPAPSETPSLAVTPAEGKSAPKASATLRAPTSTATLAPSPTPAGWSLPALTPFGDLPNEGIWQPYLHDNEGGAVAMRTFLQPDPERPYALVAVVAVNLNQVDLHYVLGMKEPAMPGSDKHGLGIIPLEDRQAGRLLAAFNGGFIAEHGYYGAMADGLTPLGAKTGLATLVIYKDGRVALGEWGTDLTESGEYQAYRQNALMVVHNGEIAEKVYNGNYLDWGANLDGAIVTIRSGVGLSEDGSVLYYFAGPSLSMPSLAEAMLRAGAHNSMLLDINPTHAHFAAISSDADGKLSAEALFPEIMDLWVERYLGQWGMDFFYLTNTEALEH